MNAAQQSLRKQQLNILEETFESEAVIINIASGYYFSLNGAGTEIWQLFGQARDPAEIEQRFSAEQMEFVAQLRTQELLLASDDPAVQLSGEIIATETPKLERFDEMADLLQFDPVHDIDLDGDGWPVLREGFTRPPASA